MSTPGLKYHFMSFCSHATVGGSLPGLGSIITVPEEEEITMRFPMTMGSAAFTPRLDFQGNSQAGLPETESSAKRLFAEKRRRFPCGPPAS